MAQDHIWAPLAEGQPTHHREPGQMIYLQDTEAAQFYYILTGTVKCFISSPDGDERTLALHHGGELIGEASFFDRQPRVSSAVAVTVVSPLCGMAASSGSSQRFPAASPAMPPRMTVPACPTRRRSTVLRPEGLRRRPLILTMRDSPVPCAVAGE